MAADIRDEQTRALIAKLATRRRIDRAEAVRWAAENELALQAQERSMGKKP